MGIFSIFKRKIEQPAVQVAAPDTRVQASEADRARQREIARATAAKIDAIESAMAFDIFNEPEPAWGSGIKPGARSSHLAAAPGAASAPTLPMMELATTELLADEEVPDAP
ncbi:MAG TPA: hypothetical protein VF861_06845 [Telluria sp.]